MGSFLPAFLALIQYACGIYLFKRPDLDGCGPLISCLLVMFSFFLILWTIQIYPRQLKKLWSFGQFLVEYLIYTFLMETVMGSFWFPIERLILLGLPRLGQSTDDMVSSHGWSCDVICDVLKWTITGVILCYIISFIIFVAALHATRCIDLGTLDRGIGYFVQDIVQRIRKRCRTVIKIHTPRKPIKKVSRTPSNNSPCDYESMEIDDVYLGLDPFAYQEHPRPR